MTFYPLIFFLSDLGAGGGEGAEGVPPTGAKGGARQGREGGGVRHTAGTLLFISNYASLLCHL